MLGSPNRWVPGGFEQLVSLACVSTHMPLYVLVSMRLRSCVCILVHMYPCVFLGILHLCVCACLCTHPHSCRKKPGRQALPRCPRRARAAARSPFASSLCHPSSA